MNTRYASRKFLIAVFAMMSATFLVYNGDIADGVYSTVVIAAIGLYGAANVAQKAIAKIQNSL